MKEVKKKRLKREFSTFSKDMFQKGKNWTVKKQKNNNSIVKQDAGRVLWGNKNHTKWDEQNFEIEMVPNEEKIRHA